MRKISNLSIVSSTVVLVLIVPQIAFAAWWNPFSWFNNWSFSNKTVVHVPAQTEPITSPIIISTSTSAVSTTTVQAQEKSNVISEVKPQAKPVTQVKGPTPPIETSGASVTPTPRSTDVVVGVPTPVIDLPNHCNGKSYAVCKDTESFVCPSSGYGYCESAIQAMDSSGASSQVSLPPTASIGIDVTAGNTQKLTGDAGTFTYYVKNNSPDKILTLTGAELRLALAGGAMTDARTKISVTGNSQYLAPVLFNNIGKTEYGEIILSFDNPITVMPLSKVSFDIYFYGLWSGSFSASAGLTIIRFHTPNSWAKFSSPVAESTLHR